MRCVFAGHAEGRRRQPAGRCSSRGHEVVAVLTRPDAPAGRGRREAASAVAGLARSAGLEVLQPSSTRDPILAEELRRLAPDCAPIVAYGGLIPPALLAIPRHGWVNLHFSLLPAWRGAAPVQHAVWHGDDVTGATTFALDAGMDTGPVYGTVTEAVRPDDTSGDLLGPAAPSWAQAFSSPRSTRSRSGAVDGRPAGGGAEPGPEADSRRRARAVGLARGRGRSAGPRLHVRAWGVDDVRRERVRIHPVAPAREVDVAPLAPGELLVTRRDVLVGTATRPVRLGLVQPAGQATHDRGRLGARRTTDE